MQILITLLLLTLSWNFFVSCFLLPHQHFICKQQRPHRTNSLPRRLLHPSNDELPLGNEFYEGPEAPLEDMVFGVSVEDLGLDIMVGHSTISRAGLGLFLAVSENNLESSLPAGTAICGYSKGIFSDDFNDLSSVAFAFDSADTSVIFNKKISPLKDAVLDAASNQSSTFSISDILVGHEIFLDDTTGQLRIFPDESYKNRYFIPNSDSPMSIESMGRFANDLAYLEGVNSEEYQQIDSIFNALSLIWRLEYANGKLRPTWPVVVLRYDTKFTNNNPMEVGLPYSWRYWDAFSL